MAKWRDRLVESRETLELRGSPWFQLAVAILAHDGLGEELAGDVFRDRGSLGEAGRSVLAQALHGWLRGAAVRRDLESLIKMASPLWGRGGFRSHIRPMPTMATCLAHCWAKIHAEETVGVAHGMLATALRGGEDGVRRLMCDDPLEQLKDACARSGVPPRRGMVAAAVVCLLRADGVAVGASEAKRVVSAELEHFSNGSTGVSSMDESMSGSGADGAVSEDDLARFEDSTLQVAWDALTAIAYDAATWDEGERFARAVNSLVATKISKRASLSSALHSALDELNRESGDMLVFLGVQPLPQPQGLTPRKAAELLSGLAQLRPLLAEGDRLRAQAPAASASAVQMRKVLAAIDELVPQIETVRARFADFSMAPSVTTAPFDGEGIDAAPPPAPVPPIFAGPPDLGLVTEGAVPAPVGGEDKTHAGGHELNARPTGMPPNQDASTEVDQSDTEASPPAEVEPAETQHDRTGPQGAINPGIDPPPVDQQRLAEPDLTLELVRNPERMRAKKSDSTAILCLDFGTARSKAFATQRTSGRTQDLVLPIGSVAKTGEPFRFSLGSSAWIDEEHRRIYFGQKALERSQVPKRAGHHRIDSIKAQLSLAQMVDKGFSDPAAKRIIDGSNPTDVEFTHGDILLLFLGFLTWAAEESLRQHESGPKHRYVTRRFALPSWKEEKRAAGTQLLRTYLARAQLIADTVGDRWYHGLPIEDAKRLTDAVLSLPDDELPFELLDEGVLEPIAAGATRIELRRPQRRLVMVVDVGAGTTDYAVFFVQEDPETELFRMRPVSVHTWNRAGDYLDNVLRVMLLEKSGYDKGIARDALSEQILLRQRSHKEDLFTQKEISVVLGDEALRVNLTLDEFLRDERVNEFASMLEKEFEKALAEAGVTPNSRFAQEVWLVVLTGGGAGLPMVKALAKGKSQGGVQRRQAPELPPNVPREIAQEYLQLAVAWGGAMPDLPQLGKTIVLPGPPVGPPHPGVVLPPSPSWRSGDH